MIGSLMSRLGDAEKLSVGQLQKAIQDGTIPAFVGIPMLQDKVKLAKAVQDAQAASNTQQMPIAQQVMAEAKGIEQAQSNLPQTYSDGGILNFQPVNTDDSEHEYAGGGMVAFANRGLVDDEEDDDEEDDSSEFGMSKEEQRIFASLMPQQSPMSEEEAAGIAGLMGGQPTGTGIRGEAKAPSGIETLEARVLRQESGGRRYDKEGNLLTSPKGAEGEMQVMRATQRDPGYGVRPARDNSPDEIARVGRDYLRALYNKYDGDEKLTLMAYNWGPGNVDRWRASGKGIDAVPMETRKYAGLAHGGTVHFKDTGLVEDIYGLAKRVNPSPSEWGSGIMDFLGLGKNNIVTGLQDIAQKGKEAKIARDLKVTSPYADQAGDYPQTVEEGQGEINTYNADLQKAADDKAATEAAAAAKAEEEKKAAAELNKEDTDISEYRKWLKSYGEDIKKQRETDKYMSLLAAGLGMMGGTSPFAAANIGQGGMKGIEAALAAQKATGADQRALMAGQAGLTKATLYDKMRRDALAQKALSDKALAEYRQKQLELGGAKIKAAENAAYLKARKQFMDEGQEQKIQAKYVKKYGKDFMSDPVAARNYQLEINSGINELARINSADEVPLSSER
jgi:hypothetical protein